MDRKTLIGHIDNGDLYDYTWYREMFSIPLDENNRYFNYDTKTKIVTMVYGEKIKLGDGRNTPLLLSDKVELNKGDINVTTDGIYTLGDIILNCLQVYYPLKDRIPFKENLTFGMVEDYISNELGRSVTVDEYEKFVEATDLLKQMAELFVTSSTDKSISPTPGISEYRDKLFKEYYDKYGDKVDTDIRYIVEIEKLLTDYEREYLKDDPTYGIVINEKVLTNARKTLFGTIGAEIGMDGKITPIVKNSLVDGYPTDNEQLASLYNSSRKGSIMRGHMTQYTGADANVTGRVLNTITVVPGDCKTNQTLDISITNDNADEYINYYIMVGGSPILLTPTNISSYIGKTVKLRNYMNCIQTGGKYCSTCSGRQGEDNKKIAIILSTENSAIFTNSSMKAMHDRTLKLVDYDLNIALF